MTLSICLLDITKHLDIILKDFFSRFTLKAYLQQSPPLPLSPLLPLFPITTPYYWHHNHTPTIVAIIPATNLITVVVANTPTTMSIFLIVYNYISFTLKFTKRYTLFFILTTLLKIQFIKCLTALFYR